VALFVGNLCLEKGTQLSAVGPRQLCGILRVHHDRLVFAGQIVIETVNEHSTGDRGRSIGGVLIFVGRRLAIFLDV
jgi:hypothetical protein